jgi:hypothetical protein
MSSNSLAVYIIGDEYQAGCAITNTFFEGYCFLGEMPFKTAMLRCLIRACECCTPVKGKKYIKFINEKTNNISSPIIKELSRLEVTERSILLLTFAEGCDGETAAKILDVEVSQLQAALSRLCYSINYKINNF